MQEFKNSEMNTNWTSLKLQSASLLQHTDAPTPRREENLTIGTRERKKRAGFSPKQASRWMRSSGRRERLRTPAGRRGNNKAMGSKGRIKIKIQLIFYFKSTQNYYQLLDKMGQRDICSNLLLCSNSFSNNLLVLR